MAAWLEQLRLPERTREISFFLKAFVRQPFISIRKLPNWDFETSILLVAYCSIASAILTGLFMKGFLALISSIILVPLMTLIGLGLATAFFHYAFIFLYDRSIDWKKVFQVLAVALIPFMILRVLGHWLGPIVMIAFAITCVLLIVGFVDNFYLPKRGIIKLMGLIFSLFFCQWVYSTIKNTPKIADYRDRISNDSLKVLDAEFSDELKKNSEE
ncbi:MAG: hypothetical protein AB7F59_04895 [Bdellovibrionales bacterium]